MKNGSVKDRQPKPYPAVRTAVSIAQWAKSKANGSMVCYSCRAEQQMDVRNVGWNHSVATGGRCREHLDSVARLRSFEKPICLPKVVAPQTSLCYNLAMCGRFTLHTPANKLVELFGLAEEPILAPRYNIAPTQPVAVVRFQDPTTPREWVLMYWGLVPSWSKDPSIGSRLINARSETAHEKPSFRAAFRRRRCLLPADGFYEWKRTDTGKQPYYISMRDGSPFALAGLWEYWEGGDGSSLESCTILTTTPNECVEPLHDRMPVIVAPEDYDEWLGNGDDSTQRDVDVIRHLLRAYSSDAMTSQAVSKYVNSSANEGARCIQLAL